MLDGIKSELPEVHRATLSALELRWQGQREHALPSMQSLVALYRYIARRSIEESSTLICPYRRALLDTGAVHFQGAPAHSDQLPSGLVRSISEWIEDALRPPAGEAEGHLFSRCVDSIHNAESRVRSLADRIRTTLPLLLSTLGSPTSDGGVFIMPKNRSEKLTDYYLESLDAYVRGEMRFRAIEDDDASASTDEAEKSLLDSRQKRAGFPKLTEGFRRLRGLAREEDGSDLVVERLLAGIDSLCFETFFLYSQKKGLLEIKRRKSELGRKANEAHMGPERSLVEVLKIELDRVYTSAERAFKALPLGGSAGVKGYSPFSFKPREGEDNVMIACSESRTSLAEGFEKALLKILNADRGIFGVNRVRARGLPEILLLPGNAVPFYDRIGDTILLPFASTRERTLDHLVEAIGSFRWKSDDSLKIQNLWSDLQVYKGKRPDVELEPSFVRGYSKWLKCEMDGTSPAEDETISIMGEALRKEGAFVACYA